MLFFFFSVLSGNKKILMNCFDFQTSLSHAFPQDINSKLKKNGGGGHTPDCSGCTPGNAGGSSVVDHLRDSN